MNEKVVLCFGDSNTWGAVPGREGRRHARDVRWTGILAAELGSGWHVVEDGVCGRTTILDDPVEIAEDKNGMRALGVALSAHAPIDLVVIMLGTNDAKARFSFTGFDTAEAVGLMADRVRASVTKGAGLTRAPEVLVVCPPPLAEVGDYFGRMFVGGRAKSEGFRREFARMAEERNVSALFAEDVAAASPADGLHYSAADHAALGKLVAGRIKTLIK